ncbi:MAG: ABC transporter permease [Acidobacteriota bacterium]|nr:ABC transporter permease [Acidobacteriota bacterium]
MLLATYSLWARDIIRFYRQRSRVIGALGTPVVFWLLLGSGLGSSFRVNADASVNYLQYFFPGTLALIVLFTAIFSTISVIEDRREGFLQGVLVAPVPRATIVVGKLLSGTTLAVLQAMLFLLLAPATGIDLRADLILPLVVALLTLAFALTGLGFLVAWQLDSTQGFHAVMNLVMVPMWLLSGAVFPAEGAAWWIRVIMWANPMTYGVTALREVLTGGTSVTGGGLPSFAMSLIVVLVFGCATTAIGILFVRSKRGR